MGVTVKLQNVKKQFNDFIAVKGIDLCIEPGAFHFLLGPSGSGKTTTLRMIAGLEKVSSGTIYFNGEDVTQKPASKRGIGMVFQNYALWPHMTVYENVAYPLKIEGKKKHDIAKRVHEVLGIMELENLENRYPSELSGGQQQRVAVARALAIRPRVLLFDEPLSNLDARLRTSMRDRLIKLHKDLKVTIIYVTHDQKDALAMGTHVTVIHKGSEVQTGKPRDLYLSPKSVFLASFIGDTNFIDKGIIHTIQEGVARVKTPLGFIEAVITSDKFKEGDEVCLSIRPESIKIDLGKHELATKGNVIEGRLLRTVYLGEVDQLHLQLENAGVFKVSLFNAPDYNIAIGDVVKCFFKSNKVTVLPKE